MFKFFKSQESPSKPVERQAHVTTGCGRHGHPEFRMQISASIPSPIVQWFLTFLEERVAAGERFGGGESLQVGWMYARVEKLPDGLLRIVEPDMKSIPIQFVDSVDNTLHHLFIQKETARSFLEVTPNFPSLRQSVVLHQNYRTARRVLLSRFPAKDETDSGWWFTDMDDEKGSQDPGQFSKTSLYQLGVDRPDLIKFFALPAGLQVVIEPGRIGVIDDKGELELLPGSYLSEWNQARG